MDLRLHSTLPCSSIFIDLNSVDEFFLFSVGTYLALYVYRAIKVNSMLSEDITMCRRWCKVEFFWGVGCSVGEKV